MAKAEIKPSLYLNRLFLVTALTAYCGVILYLVSARIAYTPTPAGPDAPPQSFSEARARVHLKHLAMDIGNRQAGVACGMQWMSHPGMQGLKFWQLLELQVLRNVLLWPSYLHTHQWWLHTGVHAWEC